MRSGGDMNDQRDGFAETMVRVVINLSALVVTGALVALVIATIVHEAK